MLMEEHDGKLLHANVEELKGSVAASNHELVLVEFGPGQVIYRIVGIEPARRKFASLLVSLKPVLSHCPSPLKSFFLSIKTHVFSTWMPCAVSARAKSLPFPTMPKLAAVPTAMRESWYGEYLTA